MDINACPNKYAFTTTFLEQFTWSARGAIIGIANTANPLVDWITNPMIININSIITAKIIFDNPFNK